MTSILKEYNEVCEQLRNELVKKELLIEPFISIVEELFAIGESLNDPVISGELDNYSLKIQSPIEKYGVASNVINLAEDGKSPEEISASLEYTGVIIDKKDIKQWLKQYENLPALKKLETSRGSIFDTQFQLQEIFERLHTLLERVEDKEDADYARAKVVKEQVVLDYMKEIRQSVKDASALAATVASMQSVENFKQIVVEEISKLEPAVAQRIWRKIREAKQIHNTMNIV